MYRDQQQHVLEENMPLSVQLHRLPIESENLWVWHVLPEINAQVDEQTLHAQGWEIIEPVALSYPMLALMSQFASTLPVLSMGKTVIKTWVKKEDLGATSEHPVILAFRYGEHQPEQAIMVSRPPLGEIGIILEEDRLHIYQLDMLGEDGNHWSEHLQQLIDRMMVSTKTVSTDIVEWKEAQRAARNLAALYWELHIHREGTIEGGAMIEMEPSTIIPFAEKKPKRTRGSKREVSPLVIRDPEAVEISTDQITQALLRGLLSDDLYTLYPDRLVAEHRKVFPTEQGEVKITIRPGSQETWTHVLESLSALGDAVVDTFCALVSLAYDANSQHDLTQSFFLNVDDILRVCRRKESNRSFTPLQRASAIQHIITLSRVHVTATLPVAEKRGGRRKTRYIDSVVLDLLGTVIGEYETLTGDVLWERREVKIGPWARYAPFGPQTALLFRVILEYHSQRQRYAKRIGRFLTIQFFIRAQQTKEGTLDLSIKELLEQSGIKPDHDNPSRTRKMVEEALQRLQKDQVIQAYARIIEAATGIETPEQQVLRLQREREVQSQIDQCAQGWWHLYEAQRWSFEAPSFHTTFPLLQQPE